jgi:penicillin-binding protein 1A
MNGDEFQRRPRETGDRAREWWALRRAALAGERSQVRGWLRRRFRHWDRRRTLIAILAAATLVWVGWERCGVAGCPRVERLVSYQPGGASVVLDREGREIGDLAPFQRVVVRLDSLPVHLPQAFLAVEDQRFFEHEGIDWRRVGGALVADVQARGFVQGFSTITMQLARNIFPDRLPGQQRTLRRKLMEIRVALEIERRFTKHEILELYLNHIYFGGGAYGVEAAARSYFGKSATRLDLAESALLAALPKGPNLYDPRRYAERARERRDLVLALMAAQRRVEPEAAEAATARRLGVRRDPPATRRESGFAPYYIDALRRVLEDRFGEELYTSTLRIHTTLDRAAQQAAEEELNRQLRSVEQGAHGRYRGARYSAAATPGASGPEYLQGAVVVLDAATGDVLALVGGRDWRHSRFNRATRARRQAGSAFKPFVFAAALERGYAPSQWIADAPLRMELAGGEIWEPRNFAGEFEGNVTLRAALARSKNVPTVRLAAAVGTDDVARLARRAGIRSRIPDQPSMALGTGAVTPLELTAAYTAFARQGEAVEPRFVLRVERGDGKVVWGGERVRYRQVMDPEVAFLVTDILEDAVSGGTASAVRRVGFRGPAAGKTGTTTDAADAWFVGYTPELVASVWIGFDMPRAVVDGATGGRLAAPVWGRMMRRIQAERGRPDPWDRPDRVLERPVDPTTGLVLAEGCRPVTGGAATEFFVKGLEPATSCPAGDRIEEPGAFDRVFAWVRGAWQRAAAVVATHVGRERRRPVPDAGDRYLGAPRLPRAAEITIPEINPELYEAPDWDHEIVIPGHEPLAPETAAVRVLGRPYQPDTLPPADTIWLEPAPDTVPPRLQPPRPPEPPPGRGRTPPP